ncbi:MAG: preprotein translocase subunit SecA, partial [Crocinitomicaceae bacterium]
MAFAKKKSMIGDILKKIFGDKSSKDKKLYWPFVDQATAALESIKSLSDNDLRSKTNEFKKIILEEKQALEDELTELRAKAEDLNTPIEEKEELFERVERLEKRIDEQIEESLLKILPEAFAVIKETAFRWANNGKLVVDVQDFDRELAAKKDGITIDGNQAIW